MDYKKILEGVVDIINTAEKSDIGFVNICTYIGENCPELAESEDEKIRKELIDIVEKSPITFAFEDKGKVLAWLEKQGEQKPAWNEEDKRMFDYALDMIEWYGGKNEKRVRLVSDWLKSLKERIGE